MAYNPMLGYLPTFTGPGPGPGTLPGALPPLPAGAGPSTTPPAPTPGNSGNSGNSDNSGTTVLRRWMQQYGPVYQALMARQDRDGAGAGRESNRAPMGETRRTALNGFGMTPDLFRQITAVGGFIPGPVGWAMTGANIAGGLNNVAAVNAARKLLGMPALDAGQTIGTTLGYNGYGKEGFVGDLNIGRETYGVSAGPRNGGGYLSGGLLGRARTTLTPMEAVNRQILNRAIGQGAGRDAYGGADRNRVAGDASGVKGDFGGHGMY